MDGVGLFAALAAFIVAFGCIGIILYIVTVVGMFKTFEKMNIEGWKAIIPIYNDYSLAEKVWVPNYVIFFWVAALVNNFVVSPISKVGGLVGGLFALVGFVLLIFFIVARARFCYWISKAFGYDVGFAAGLFFAPFVCFLILGFGEAQYQGNVFKDTGLQY
jgi:hypothetical protein